MLKTFYLKEIKVFSVFHQAILSPSSIKRKSNLIIISVHTVDRKFLSVRTACYRHGALYQVNGSGHEKNEGQGKQSRADEVLYVFLISALGGMVLEKTVV